MRTDSLNKPMVVIPAVVFSSCSRDLVASGSGRAVASATDSQRLEPNGGAEEMGQCLNAVDGENGKGHLDGHAVGGVGQACNDADHVELKPCSGLAGVDGTCCRSWICQYS